MSVIHLSNPYRHKINLKKNILSTVFLMSNGWALDLPYKGWFKTSYVKVIQGGLVVVTDETMTQYRYKEGYSILRIGTVFSKNEPVR